MTRSGSLIKEKFEALVRRDLTPEEALKCEELALNYFTGPILTYLEREAKRPVLAMFESVYAALNNGKVRGAQRSVRRIELLGRLSIVFKKLDLFKPGMSDGEALAVIEMADKFKDSHIDRAIAIARSRGVQHVRYVLQVCVGNEKKPTAPTKKAIVADEPFKQEYHVKAADVEKSWAKSLEKAEERHQLNEIERMVRRDG